MFEKEEVEGKSGPVMKGDEMDLRPPAMPEGVVPGQAPPMMPPGMTAPMVPPQMMADPGQLMMIVS